MTLQDRIVEYPGRVTLTPVPGETNTYDMARAEGAVTQEGTQLNKDNLISAFGLVAETLTGTVTYEAGTVGTRATAVNLGTASKTGMILISLVVIGATSASAYHVQPYVSGGTVYAGIYRANTGAVTDASISVRAVWAPVLEE